MTHKAEFSHPNAHKSSTRRAFIKPMRARSPDEVHRVSTPLELLFDLVFVVAVASAGAGLHHGLSEGHAAHAIMSYLFVFFGIWWAWMNFSWFGSAYDNDDVLFRLFVFVQMAGALVMAAGASRAFEFNDITMTTIGYTIMRLGSVSQWVRAAINDPEHRPTAKRYAIGVACVQVGWVARLFLPETAGIVMFVVLGLLEAMVPLWAERFSPTTWHAEHIAERYGLFTIIVLGESILSASTAVQSGMADGAMTWPLAAIALGGLMIVFSMWWMYFDQPAHDLLTSVKAAFLWGYGHYFVFASAAAVGAGLAVAVDYQSGKSHIDGMMAGAAVAVPVAIYMLFLWWLICVCSQLALRAFWRHRVWERVF